MKMIKITCEHCKKEFEKSDYFIRAELKKDAEHKFFCSMTCVYHYKRTSPVVKAICTFCKKECMVSENELKRNKNFYCSWECYENKRNYSKQKLELICPQCNKKFTNTVAQLRGKRNKGAKNIYCTSKCSSEAQRTDYSKDFIVKCDNCGIDVTRKGVQLKLSKFHFCTPSCKASYYHKANAMGEHRSLLEEKLEEHVKNTYPRLKMILNDKEQMRGLELDIYLPEISLAIEVNGPAHYIPIWNDETLLRTQKNDIIKKNRCRKKRIRLLTISETINYNNDNSLETFEKYIKPIIDGLLPLTNIQPMIS